jgi:two-component system phosphate regulon sensor histidine kinase PhoR
MRKNSNNREPSVRTRSWHSRLRGSAILMVIAILGITGFQAYWLKNNYDREKQSLEIKTNAAFRQTILKLQASKLKLERISLRFDSATKISDVFVSNKKGRSRKKFTTPINPNDPPISLMHLIQEKMRDSLKKSFPHGTIMISQKGDTVRRMLVDTSTGMRTTMRTINLVRSDSLRQVPQLVQDVEVNSQSKEPGKRKITVTYGGMPPIPVSPDSISFQSKGDVFVERQIPGHEGEGMIETGVSHRNNSVFQFLYDVDSLSQKDSVTLREIDSAFAIKLKEERINVDFNVNRLDSSDFVPANAVTIGFSKPATYELSLQGTLGYMFGKLKLPLLFSLLLVGITIASFVLLYRNMLKQQRLAELKNEFISNITHELKTPIATVGVAIEALKSFNAIHDTKRTEEYLDISQNELQRLNLLVDKVLKLSMFEKKELELKYETMDLKDVVNEVVGSMRLQLEKYHAQVTVNVEGDCVIQGDRLHLLSVVFNLLDNALKYGNDRPVIEFNLEEKEHHVVLRVADNGIGIPPEYNDKVFEKFFRIPHGDTHNAKGYGLGLSYVAQVVKKHRGTIEVESQEGKGATFIITLPRQANGAQSSS